MHNKITDYTRVGIPNISWNKFDFTPTNTKSQIPMCVIFTIILPFVSNFMSYQNWKQCEKAGTLTFHYTRFLNWLKFANQTSCRKYSEAPTSRNKGPASVTCSLWDSILSHATWSGDFKHVDNQYLTLSIVLFQIYDKLTINNQA